MRLECQAPGVVETPRLGYNVTYYDFREEHDDDGSDFKYT